LHRLIDDGGIDPDRLLPGTGTCALPDTVRLTRAAVEAGCRGVLMLPPFYYKGVSDDGLFASFDAVIQTVGDSRLRVYLYHFPQLSQAPLSPDLVGRLIAVHPGTVVGLKDSSGDWDNTRTLLERFPGFGVFPGSEARLLDALRLGAPGCISATANVNPGGIAAVIAGWQGADVADLQARAAAVRAIFTGHPLVPALKAVMAAAHRDETWCRPRPPHRSQ
jgi:4-hydroxy-tetrahydrodipicolinate synthase